MRNDKPRHTRAAKTGAPITAHAVLLIAVLLMTMPTMASAQAVSMKEVEAAVLREDWKQVATLLESVSDDTQKSPDPVLRLIKGHACLALNGNNESLCLFLSVTAPEDLEEYCLWAQRFAARNSKDAIAHYFQGDAAARLHNWSQAIARYGYALKLNVRHALAYNARGVARASNGDYRSARVDFNDAVTYSDRRLADAHANIGALCLQRKDGAKGGLRAFDEALKISSDFALALHGRGCVKTILYDSGGAAKDLEAAELCLQSVGAHKLLIANGLRYQAYWRGMTGEELLASLAADEDAGTTFDARVRAAKDNAVTAWNNYAEVAGHGGAQRKFNRYFEEMGRLQRFDQSVAQQVFDTHVEPDIASSTRIANGHQDGLNAIERTNKNGGLTTWGQGVTRFGGVGASVAGGAAITGMSFGSATVVGASVAGVGSLAANETADAMGRSSNYHMDTLRQYERYGGSSGPMTGARMQAEMRAFMNSQAQRSSLPSGGPGQDAASGIGGAQAKFTRVKRDNGCWPFVGYFALVYSDQCADVPVEDILETLSERGNGHVRRGQQ